MKLLRTLLILIGTSFALTAFAAGGYELKVGLGNDIPAGTEISSLSSYIVLMYRFSFLIGGLLAIGIIVYNSILYTVSAGNSGMQGEAKDGILHALYGLGLLAATFLILNTINPDLVNLKDPGLDIPGIDYPQQEEPNHDAGLDTLGLKPSLKEETEIAILRYNLSQLPENLRSGADIKKIDDFQKKWGFLPEPLKPLEFSDKTLLENQERLNKADNRINLSIIKAPAEEEQKILDIYRKDPKKITENDIKMIQQFEKKYNYLPQL